MTVGLPQDAADTTVLPAPAPPPQVRAARGGTPGKGASRPYDLVKEFVIALGVMLGLTVVLAATLSSPDTPVITLSAWAKAAPGDVAATATAELAGTSTSAGYGAPYNHNGRGQSIGPLALERWAGVQIPVDSSRDLVVGPLAAQTNDPALRGALARWGAATPDQQGAWTTAYADALGKVPGGDPAAVAPGAYGPVPQLVGRFVDLARNGSLEGLLSGATSFYGTDSTKALLLLSDGSYLADRAAAQHLSGPQWGMMNETGNYPGQPWMWLYTFWYQIKPFSTSGNADALVWAVMGVLTGAFVLLPLIPGVRDIPRWSRVHRLIWREYYRGDSQPGPS